jgi:methylenetetrahydrofolate dehydrogenase (NADP+) / methenyltetrahydrofolate cyclohydrolase
MRAVNSILLFRTLGGQRAQGFAERFRIAVDCDLLEARGRPGQDLHARLWHAQRLGQQLRHRLVGFAAIGDGADPHLHHRTAVRQRLDPVDIVTAAARGHAQGDAAVHGILVQLPLPKHLDTEAVINAIDPAKDVDGLHPANAGRLAGGFAALSPCTPLGCIILTKSVHPSLEGMNAIVIGRSNLVGRPLLQLLLNENATVTIAHSRSRDLPKLCAQADLVYAAVGKPEMVRGNWLKPGATVIDVGINRIPSAEGKTRLVGDVAFQEALDVAGAITPVPGGVGQMTVACLLVNTLRAACAIHRLPPPKV